MNKQTFDDLNKQRFYHKEMVVQIEQAISTLRKLCKHEWGDGVTGHKNTFYTCSICGEEMED